MPSSDGRSPDAPYPAPSRRRRGRKRHVARRLFSLWFGEERRRALAGADDAEAADHDIAAEIVDQAEAFATLRVADVMTPRADVVALELSTPLSEVVQLFLETEHSRMPIYRETLDETIGVVHIKDVFKLIAPTASEPERAPRATWKGPILHRISREVLTEPPSMRASDLLVKMRARRIHMAMVIDEYGGVDGLVTLEDLVEAVVGEIDDEHDEAAANAIVTRPGGVLEADARAPLDEVEQRLGAILAPEDGEEEVDTVAGLVVALAGRVPQRGEVIVHPTGYEFEVVDADPRRIRRLRIRPPRLPEEAAPQAVSNKGFA
jgi:CBS domain containing-hemolysin-like protein